MDDYVEWMDGEDGYRAWWDANYGGDEVESLKGAHPNSGDNSPPPKPPVKQ